MFLAHARHPPLVALDHTAGAQLEAEGYFLLNTCVEYLSFSVVKSSCVVHGQVIARSGLTKTTKARLYWR